jgi:P63C domain
LALVQVHWNWLHEDTDMAKKISTTEFAAKGGEARAQSLSPERRSEIARQAVIARWEKTASSSLPKATHGDPDHPLVIGDIEIPCYVLDDGTRVITHRGLQGSLGMAVSGGARETARFLSQFEDKGLDCKDLIARVSEPIEFRPKIGGRTAFGYEATVLADFCDLLLEARKRKGLLSKKGLEIASRCEVLVRGFARVGIIALVDEATGYQEVRDRFALQKILDKYLRKEFAAWAKRFPDEFYQEIFRLRKWVWRGMRINRPQCVAAYTKNLVYARLAPGILTELEQKNPITERGHRLTLHHQWLTEDIGHPALAQHLHAVLGLMRASDNWQQMMRLVNRAFPKRGDSLQMELFNKDEDEE